MKCANCKKDAVYIYQLTEKKQILYCNDDLPKFLEHAKKAGLLKTTESFKSVMQEGLQKIASLSTKVEETPVLEAETTPTPTPKKKSVKKAATKNDANS